ncbi:MAG: sulfite exporter TauE/SafE family protein [Betaproteobacteria bacterium]|nr:sulfite exporter TauE/SafE family protein [Betaproteobacteria bacterium]
MFTALTYSALLMGLAGGPHCVAMCGAACTALTHSPERPCGIYLYHLGRLVGYATLGAIATFAIQSIAWLSGYSKALHPLWTFFHILIFCWGLLLISFGRQPIWVDQAGRNIWGYIKKISFHRGGHFYVGMLWSLMPCGLLYSALIIASFNGNPLDGAISMAAFAMGSSASLFLAPWLWLKLKSKVLEPYGMRLAGLLLSAASAWAIWMELTHNTKVWCN